MPTTKKRTKKKLGATSQPKKSTTKGATPKILKLDAAELRAYIANPGPDPDPKVITYNMDRYRDQLAKAKARAQEARGEQAERDRQTVMTMQATIRKLAPTCPKCQGTLEYRWGTLRRNTPDSDEPPQKSRYFQCPDCETRYLDGLAGIDMIDGERKCPLCQGTLQHNRDWARRCAECGVLCSDIDATECPECQGMLQHDESQEWLSECAACKAEFTMMSRLGRPARVSVNQNQTRVAEDRPEYVVEILWQLDAAIANPANRAILHKMLNKSAENYVSLDLTDPRAPTPQVVTVADMAKHLSALHDNRLKDRPPILPADWWTGDGPWPGHAGQYIVLGKTDPSEADMQAYWARVKAELSSAAKPDEADTSPDAAGEQLAPDPALSLSKKARAIAALQDHPDWSDTDIAKEAGCNRTTLYTWPDFVKAREIVAAARADMPKGKKNGETGTVEPWD